MNITVSSNIVINSSKVYEIIGTPFLIDVNEFTEASVNKFITDFNNALNSSQPIIPIRINSYGGQVDALLSMIDICKTSPKSIATIVLGKAMSCGAVLATCGTEGYRYAAPLSRLMIHEVSMSTVGKNEDLKNGSREIDRLNETLFEIMVENCGKNKKYFKKLIQEKGRVDYYMTAEEAKKHNIVNHVYIPEMKINLNVNYEFK